MIQTRLPRMPRRAATVLALGSFLGATPAAAGMVQDWLRTYDAITGHDMGRDVAVDSKNNVIVTGSSLGFVPGFNYTYEYATVKYNAAGTQLWVARYNGPGGSFNDEPIGVGVDAADNVYVSGSSPGGATDLDIATVKYDPNGVEMWVRRWNSPANRTDGATGMVVDAAGNVYVSGHSYSPSNVTDMVTLKYDTDGNLLWEAMYGAGFGTDVSSAIALGPDGSVYVTGESIQASGFYDWATVKYDADGNQQWVAFVDGPSHSHDYAYALAVNTAGDAYVTGYTVTKGNYTLTTVAYTSGGAELWLHYAELGEVGSTLSLDTAGNLLVGCWSGLVVSYDPLGAVRWTYDFGGSNAGRPAASLADATGNWYLTGYATVAGQKQNYHTVKLDTDGNELWATSYNNADWDDGATALALDLAGNVVVTGSTDTRTANDLDYCTIRYIPDPAAVGAATARAGLVVTPQPAIGSTTLRLALGNESPAQVEIVDASGRVLERLRVTGSDAIPWQAPASGVYWAVLRSGADRSATRITVIR